MASHFSVLAWRIPGTGEPGGLPSMGSHRVGHDWSDLAPCYLIWDMIWSFCVYNSVFLFTTSCYPGNIFPYSYQLCRNMLLLLLLLLSRSSRVRLCATP